MTPGVSMRSVTVRKAVRLQKTRLAAFLERDVVVVAEAVDADHRPPVGQQAFAQVIADEAGGSGDEGGFAIHQSVPSEWGPEIQAQELAHISSRDFSVLKPKVSAAFSARAT
jgi:hypothetical protein